MGLVHQEPGAQVLGRAQPGPCHFQSQGGSWSTQEETMSSHQKGPFPQTGLSFVITGSIGLSTGVNENTGSKAKACAVPP